MDKKGIIVLYGKDIITDRSFDFLCAGHPGEKNLAAGIVGDYNCIAAEKGL